MSKERYQEERKHDWPVRLFGATLSVVGLSLLSTYPGTALISIAGGFLLWKNN